MDCEEARFGLYALLDDELEVTKNLEILSHLEGCPTCHRELELDMRLKPLVREQLAAPAPSPELWNRIVQRIEQEANDARGPSEGVAKWWPTAGALRAVWGALAIVLALGLFWILHPGQVPSPFVEELVQEHRGSVTRKSGPVDLPSTDPAEIIRHFQAEVPVSSPVPLLAHEGARLVGGSVCHFKEAKGLRFTYEVGPGRTVSLYQMPRPTRSLPFWPRLGPQFIAQSQGPGVLVWGDARFLYGLVGELSQEDLQRLASHMKGI
ncbi:MAG: anti-sigma factor [Candidatus Methylomirabilis oxyfera]|nr:anti-sigma factor [Candidatus Methylomirabilis oxyfera]